MKRSTATALLGITLLSVLLRLSPLLGNLHWGADFGEYYSLTRALATDGVVPSPYRGWGVTYPYFPGILFLNGALVESGLGADLTLSLLVPILASLSVLPAFLLAVRVSGDDLAGLLAAAFVAVVAFHVYPTSHSTPGAIGDLLMITGIIAFLGLRASTKWFIPLILIAISILVTHHLTMYMFLLATTAILWLRGILERDLRLRSVRFELLFLGAATSVSLLYAFAYARPFWSLVVGASPLPPAALAVGSLVPLALFPVLLRVRRRQNWRYRPKIRPRRTAAALTGGIAGLAVGLFVAAGTAFPVPGSSVFANPADVVLYVPTVAFFSVGAAGRRFLDFSRHGIGLTAWFGALAVSFVLGALIAPDTLIPYRHFQYATVPVAAMVGLGFRYLFSDRRWTRRAIATGAAGALVCATALTALPPADRLAGFDAGISSRSVETALWLRLHGSGLVGGDHRVSTVVFGYAGLDATWDREARFWHTVNTTEALQSMSDVRVADEVLGVQWIVVDEDLRRAVQLSPFAPAIPLSPDEESKFTRAPFHKVYDSGYAQAYWFNAGLAP